jgi:UDP:flavonoid glycosyltransferase YjiC (YdhE family)
VNFAFVMVPERGGYYPTFSFAKALVARGHRVSYFGPVDFEDDVLREGLDYVTLFREEFPSGHLDSDPEPEGGWSWLRRFKRRLGRPGRYRMTRALASGEFVAELRRHGVDLVLVDAHFGVVVPPLSAAGFRLVNLGTEFFAPSTAQPPPSSAFVPRGTSWSRTWCRLLWLHRMTRFYGRVWLWQFLQAVFRLEGPPREAVEVLRRMERDCSIPRRFSDYGWLYDLPEIMLSPRAFEFPVTLDGADGGDDRRVYAGHSIDLGRHAVPFPWERLPAENRGLVYVSLGTHAAMYRNKTGPFLEKVMAVARQLPHLSFVVVLGKGRDAAQFEPLPQNVIAVQFAPQLEMLRRASVMITNGGLGTVKECIWFKVPLIVVPCMFDQPGNAARVVCHGVGRRADVQRVTVDELRNLVEDCLGNPAIHQALARLSTAFHDGGEFESCLAWLEESYRVTRGELDRAS